ncbi:MAG: fimbrillin family protein [Bacteroidales bacterium]|nr:fimbrillin family protein [Bacteroidales bacterium]
MKKYFYLAVAACAALAACSKNEVTPIDVDQEITFQTVVNKASSRAMIDGTTYDKTNTFGTVAYAQSTGTPLYIPISEVKYYNLPKNYWSTEKAYYWPKKVELTFYSYSPYYYQESGHTSTKINFTSTKDGLTLNNYSVKDHQETDLMVADPQIDQTPATTKAFGGSWAAGVPTIFHHMLAQLKNVTFQTVDGSDNPWDYTNGHGDGTWEAGDKQFQINEVKILDFYEIGKLNAGLTNTWDIINPVTASYDYYTGTGIFGQVAFSTKAAGEYYLLLPQDLTTGGQKLYIKYTIKTFNGSDWVDEPVEVTTDLKDIITTEKWEMNKKYTLNIRVSLNQIYWDPQVAPWTEDSFDYTVTD